MRSRLLWNSRWVIADFEGKFLLDTPGRGKYLVPGRILEGEKVFKKALTARWRVYRLNDNASWEF